MEQTATEGAKAPTTGRRPRRSGGTATPSTDKPSTPPEGGDKAVPTAEQGKAADVAQAGTEAQPKPDAPQAGGAVPPPTEGMASKLAGLGVEGLAFTPAETVDLSAMKIMALLYGDSGAGKTHFAAMADDVVVALVDTQGFATIRSANPAAVVVGNPDKAMQGQPRLQNMGQVREFFRAAAAGKLVQAGVKTLVIDHITELQQLMIDEILAEKRARTAPPAQQTKGKVAGQANPAPAPAAPQPKGPAPEMTKADWGVLATKMRNFLRMLRGLPHHVIVLALAESTQDEATQRRLLFPKLSGSAGASLPSYFNIVGYIYKTTIDGQVQRVVLLDGDDRFYTKSYGPLHGIVQADVRLWQRLLAGEDGVAHAQGALPPGGTTGSGKPRAGSTAPTEATGTAQAEPAQDDSTY